MATHQLEAPKPPATGDHIESYMHQSGYSSKFDAVAAAHGFKPQDGRLVVDPQEARVEYGDEIADALKLSEDGKYVLWPQPSDDPNDPQNWSKRKKEMSLIILSMASFVPDFVSGIGIAGLFSLAEEYNTTTEEINNLTSNWSIFMLGPGGIVAMIFMKRYGRLPVLWWSQVLGLGFAIGCPLAPNLETFAAMRILTAFFSTAPQCVGLYLVNDLYPWHLQARKLNFWTMFFITSPFVSPFLLGFMCAQPDLGFRDAYWVGVAYISLVVILITFFLEETMLETLIGITGVKMSKHRTPWFRALTDWLNVLWRPQVLLSLLYVGVIFGFGIGINVTLPVFLEAPPPLGRGFSATVVAGCYATPIVAVVLGELTGRYLNDWLAAFQVKRNHGVFKAEMRLWTNYGAIVFFVVGFILLGFGFEERLNLASIIIGWGMAEFGILLITVCMYAYLNNCVPGYEGEVSALLNQARTLGGFAVPYYQASWAEAEGAEKPFGMEAGVAAALFLLIIPFLQFKGEWLRSRFSIHRQSKYDTNSDAHAGAGKPAMGGEKTSSEHTPT